MPPLGLVAWMGHCETVLENASSRVDSSSRNGSPGNNANGAFNYVLVHDWIYLMRECYLYIPVTWLKNRVEDFGASILAQ